MMKATLSQYRIRYQLFTMDPSSRNDRVETQGASSSAGDPERLGKGNIVKLLRIAEIIPLAGPIFSFFASRSCNDTDCLNGT